MTDPLEKALSDDGKLGEAPRHGSASAEIMAFLGRGYGLPAGYTVSRVVRHGGRDGTGLAVFISPPGGGKELRITYSRETDCSNPVKLRSRAAADTRGLTRGTLINSPKAASAMYEALCTLADHFEAADQHGQTWEWVQQLRRVAATTKGSPDSYHSLRRLQNHDYSKRLVQDPPLDKNRKPIRPIPMLLVEDATGYSYVTARHMAVFLRYDLGVEEAGSDDQILTRLSEIGGGRSTAEQWDAPGRGRQHKVHLVLYRLPEEAPDEE